MPILMGPRHSPARYSTPGLGYREPLLNGEAGTEQTVSVMRKLIHDSLNDSSFIRKAIEIVRGVPAFDDEGEVHAIYDWVKSHIRYTKDPTIVEKLYPPLELLKIRAGDCDDISMLINAFAMALGYPARLITISTQADNPTEFTHVYSEVETPAGSGNWIALDAARLDSEFGVEPPVYYRKRAWDMASDTYVDLAGNVRKMPKFLSGYLALGQDASAWSPVLQQTIAETPAIISAITGRTSASSPYGTVSSPYSSFATQYTPGYGVPPAGYQATYPVSTGITLSSTTLMLFGGAILIFMLAKK